jgi:hypothetical protein
MVEPRAVPARVVVTFTIPAGQSLSGAVDCSAGYLARIQMPAQWTPANLSFQISTDGTNWVDLFDQSGNEALIPVVPATSRMMVEPWSQGVGWYRFRSGPRAGPVIQTADRVFTVTLAA